MTMTEVPTPPSRGTSTGDHVNVSNNVDTAETNEIDGGNSNIVNEEAIPQSTGMSDSDAIANTVDLDPNSWTYIANNDDNDMVRHWKESPFAIGLTHPTWNEEPVKYCNDPWCCKPVNLTAICCRYCCVGRVGNMVVLLQRNVPYTDPLSPSISTYRPKLLIVLGPYWMVLVFVTIPMFALLSGYTFYSVTRNEESMALFIIHFIVTCGLFMSLLMVACQDPGILYRHNTPPVATEPSGVNRRNTDPIEWQWNDQALTYRPIHAKYDSECAVVIEKFDHTCPWTGTAIGKKNMFWFRIFVVFVLLDILFNSIVLTLL